MHFRTLALAPGTNSRSLFGILLQSLSSGNGGSAGVEGASCCIHLRVTVFVFVFVCMCVRVCLHALSILLACVSCFGKRLVLCFTIQFRRIVIIIIIIIIIINTIIIIIIIMHVHISLQAQHCWNHKQRATRKNWTVVEFIADYDNNEKP